MLSSKIVALHLLESCEQTWEKLCKEFDPAKWQERSWREPFELLGAALIYSYNGLINYPEDRLHSCIRPVSDWDSVWNRVLRGQRPPRFTSRVGQELFATVHFASSSFRICTSLELIGKSVRRDSLLVDHLTQATSLGCCKISKTGLTREIALAMIVAHRDEFGHGEQGQRSHWAQKRGQVFSQLYPCRILQAQLSLVDLGLDELAKLPK